MSGSSRRRLLVVEKRLICNVWPAGVVMIHPMLAGLQKNACGPGPESGRHGSRAAFEQAEVRWSQHAIQSKRDARDAMHSTHTARHIRLEAWRRVSPHLSCARLSQTQSAALVPADAWCLPLPPSDASAAPAHM